MTRYRVLKDRFVYRHGVLVAPERRQKRVGEFEKGDEFTAFPSTLLRRARRDGDVEIVEQPDLEPPESGKRRGRASAQKDHG